MNIDHFLKQYGFPALPMMTLYLGAPADEAIDPKPLVKPAPEEIRNVRE